MPPVACILAIDPGNMDSAYVVLSDEYEPVRFGKIPNQELLTLIPDIATEYKIAESAIEMVASYGMAVGREVFDTCVWVGRFTEACIRVGMVCKYIYRKDIKLHICGQTKAKDTNIRIALIDRFAKHDLKNGKGTKSNPDIFYGFFQDVWAAMAVATFYMDTYIKGV